MQFTAFPEAYDIHQWTVYSLIYIYIKLLLFWFYTSEPNYREPDPGLPVFLGDWLGQTDF
jgi:hypothetical protein